MDTDIKDLKGKRILFLAPVFFGYELKIKLKMEEMGAIVDFYDVRSVTSAKARALLKISPNIFINKTNMYYEEILRNNKDKNYDYVFIIKCDMITSKILEQMKSTFKSAKFCLYLWDSVNNIPGIKSKFKYFDKILSFDRSDASKYNEIVFRPLFYLDEYRKIEDNDNSIENEIDLSFLGTIHSDRYAIINKIEKFCGENNLNIFTFKYLQSKYIYYFYKIIKKEFRNTKLSDFSFEKMNAIDILNIVSKSRVILDIEHPKQTGLTIRTIEMIGMKKKLITTNKDIINYDFYNSQNIAVIKRDNIKLPIKFFESEYKNLDKDVYDKYSIQNWIRDVLIN